MITVSVLLLILALVAFLVAAAGWVARVNWIAVGLALITLMWLLQALRVIS